MSKFQIVLLVVFGAFIIVAVILFSRNSGSGTLSAGQLNVWGSVSVFDFNNMLSVTGLSKSEILSFNYKELSEAKLDADFVEALAAGKGPDLIILPVDLLLKNRNKLLYIPHDVVKPAEFLATFVKEGELFQTSLGAYALPMYVDPLVLYWNRDVFAKASLAAPPTYWDEIYNFITKLTVKDNAGNIVSSAMALGEVKNIPHAKEILSLLMLQAGTPIVAHNGIDYRSTLQDNFGLPQVPAQAALEFYTQFANPEKAYYSWHRSLLEAPTSFTSGKSAMYLGFASELPVLRAKNPTLDIGIAPVPQSRISGLVTTFGKLYGVAVVRTAKDPMVAMNGAVSLTSRASITALVSTSPVVPARRDILSGKPVDAAGFVFYGAALQARGWLDPEPAKSKTIFNNMIESVTSGRARVDEAVGTANTALDALLQSIQ